MNSADRINDLLRLQRQAVAVKYQPDPPDDIPRISKSALSGCTYWKLAAEGQTFYTVAADHLGCPVGAHTHGVEMPESTAKELEGMLDTMVELRYLSMDEVPGIPTLQGEFGVAIYAPLASAAFEPDVVLVSGTARQMMLLAEAAHAAGVATNASMVGRPTCAALPAVMQTGATATNLGCIGNRVYTGLDDDQLYFVIAGPQLKTVVNQLETIVKANHELKQFHQGRLATA